MASTMCVRMKLSDFIDTDIESDVMEMMDKTHTDLKTTIFLLSKLYTINPSAGF